MTTPRPGRFLEDFEVGAVYRHPLGRTISEADNTWFTLLTMNTHQSHFNAHYSEGTPYGRPLVNSGFTIALVLGQTVSDISQNAVANLEMTDIRLTHPVFVGDTLYAESICTGVRESKSRPDVGIVSTYTRGLNQDGEKCLSFRRSVMVNRRSSATAGTPFPEPRAGALTLDGLEERP
ncbi:MaoC family dehydratase [Actinomadura rugatobispora]|uniref:MaoC family dehydratase n=1 Tax=Actinomadura rugatobispora TaxID=1994 RepID=A0ABW0ZXK3_9ACTN|nr:MaoC family dehydratase [Actinomadura rugatobispora]